MPKFLNNIDLQKNELQNAVIQVITSSNPSNPKLGQIFFDGDVNQIKVCTNASGPVWEGLAMETSDSSTMFNTGLKIGYDSTSLIDFTTDDAVTIRVDNKDSLTFTYANLAITNTTTSSATEGSTIQLICDDAALMGNGHRLGGIEFKAAEDGANTLVVGAKIESFADEAWSPTENGARLVFSTTDGSNAPDKISVAVLTLDSNKLATFTGRIITDDTTDATSTTDGSLQTDGGLSVAKNAIIGDDLKLLTDSSIFSMGVDSDFTITHSSTGATIAGNPVDITAGGASIWKTTAGAITIDSEASTLTLDGNSGVSIVGNTGEIDIATSGALDLNSGAFTLDSSTLAITTTDNASISVTGTTKTLDIDATGALTIDSGTSISIGTNADKPVTIDSTTFTLDASGAIAIDGVGLSIDNVGTIANITSTSDADGEDFTIALAGATNSSLILSSTGTGADALQITASAGGIDISATGAAAGEDIDITATGSSVNITSTENAANAIYLRANGGTAETILIHSDQGTGDGSIALKSDAGGITLRSAAGKEIKVGTISGAPISIGHTTSETTVNDNLTVTGTLTATGGLTNNSGVLTILDDTTTSTSTGGKLILASDAGAALGDTHRLGVIEFRAAEDVGSTMVIGARIEATAEAAWSGTENGTALEFYTTDEDAVEGLALTLDSDQKATFEGAVHVTGNLTVAGTTTTQNQVLIENTVEVLVFEGTTSDEHQTILKVVDPTADTTFSLPAMAAGDYFIAALADAATATSAAVTATEFALLDGVSSIGTTAVLTGHGIHMNHGGTMAHTNVDTLDTYFSATTKTLTNKTLTTPVLTSPTVTTSIVPTTANAATLGTATTEWGDLFLGDGSTIKFGNGQDVVLTHVASTGLLLNSTMAIQFNDAAQYIKGSSATELEIGATTQINLETATVDLNGALDVSGTALVTGVLTTTAQQISSGGIQLATNKKLEFRDNAVYINSDADGYLEAVADTGISLKIGSTEQVILTDGVFKPTTGSDVDLGTSTVFWKDAFIDKITTTGVIELGDPGDTTVARSSAGVIKVQEFNVPLAKSFVLDHATQDVTAAVDGATDSLTFTIAHGFPTGRLVKAEVLVNSGNYDTVFADVTRPLDTTMVITFATAAVNGAYVALLTYVG